MPKKKTGISRRRAMSLASAAAIGAVMPHWASVASTRGIIETAVASKPNGSLARFRQYVDFYNRAAVVYGATGDASVLKEARQACYHKLAFVVQCEGEIERNRATVLAAHAMLERMAQEFPEVPWGEYRTMQLARYRDWGRAGGRDFYEAGAA